MPVQKTHFGCKNKNLQNCVLIQKNLARNKRGQSRGDKYLDKGETFGNRIRNFSAIFLSNVTGSHDVFDCFSKRSRTDYDERTAGSDNEVRGNESLSALAWSQGLKVSRSQDHGRMVSGFPVLLLKRKALDHSWGHIEGPKKSNLCRSLKGPTYRRSAIRRAKREGRATPALANVTSLRFMITLMSCQ